jgi:hypothetical protein
VCDLHTNKSDVVMGLVGVDNNILVMEEIHCLADSDNHRSVLYSFALSIKEEELDLPPPYWIHKLH